MKVIMNKTDYVFIQNKMYIMRWSTQTNLNWLSISKSENLNAPPFIQFYTWDFLPWNATQERRLHIKTVSIIVIWVIRKVQTLETPSKLFDPHCSCHGKTPCTSLFITTSTETMSPERMSFMMPTSSQTLLTYHTYSGTVYY